MTYASDNYLEELARITPHAPLSHEPTRELPHPETVSSPPVLSPELQEYIKDCVISTVSHAMATTVIPEVVEALKQQRPVSTPTERSAPLPSVRHQQQQEEFYQTPVPTLHTVQMSQRTADWFCWAAVSVIVAVMGGLVFYTLRQNPQTQTVRQNQQLTQSHQALSEKLVESNAQVLKSKQRCGNFSLICNIKE